MKKLFVSILSICVLTVSIWGVVSTSCESCLSGHQDVSKSCHTSGEMVQKSGCCPQETKEPAGSCEMENSAPSDCQICAHTDPPPTKIEASVNLKMDKKLVIAFPEVQNAFSNQITPPMECVTFLSSSPPIIANHVALLESIRLLI